MTASARPRHDRRSLRILIAAGGTGGHLMPALALAQELTARSACEFLIVGSPRESERQLRALVPYPAVEITAGALAGRGLAGKLRTAAGLLPSVVRALRHLRAFRPDLVVATGGYVCGPTGIAAWLARVPLLVLEQNAEPGITTRALRPLARAVAVSFQETARALGGKAVLTGNPIRATLPAAKARDGRAAEAAGGRRVRLLILGGSQGAHGLNAMVEAALPHLADTDVGLKVVHQSGLRDVAALSAAYAHHAIPATVVHFITNVGDAYAQADLVCARAGATTIAELTYCGLASVLVPYPHAAGAHQHANARALERAGATVVVTEGDDGAPLAEAILQLATDPVRRGTIAAAAAACGRDDAAAAVADLALRLIGVEPASQPTAHPPGGRPPAAHPANSETR